VKERRRVIDNHPNKLGARLSQATEAHTNREASCSAARAASEVYTVKEAVLPAMILSMGSAQLLRELGDRLEVALRSKIVGTTRWENVWVVACLTQRLRELAHQP